MDVDALPGQANPAMGRTLVAMVAELRLQGEIR
jgi:hypothetical protein